MSRILAGSGIDYSLTTGITGLPPSSALSDPVTKAELIASNNGAPLHFARVAATGTVTLATPSGTQDGVTLAIGDRILLPLQTDSKQNGIYVYNGSGNALTRATDTLSAGSMWVVTEGTTNADTLWEIKTDGAITPDTTPLLIEKGPRNAAPAVPPVKKFTATLGDGTATSLTHAYGAGDTTATVQASRIIGGTRQPTIVKATIASDGNSVTYDFDQAPLANTIVSVVLV